MSDLSASPVPAPASHRVAVIGMAGRFPGAPDLDRFWKNLVDGVESIRHWSIEELAARGLEVGRTPSGFVPVGAPLEDDDRFDAAFFGYSPAEAEILDPQQRVFLECAWHALEVSGYASEFHRGPIGIYAAAGLNTYLFDLRDDARIRTTVSPYELFVANDKDFLATRTAFKLNLRGPAVTVQTACSSSLVAVHMAVQSLLAGECDMALAGGVGLTRHVGYIAREGSILAPDGHCRAFDADAAGTVPGSGVGVVVLKRLEDAVADGDTIDAVILGSAVNNDGALKASFTAPQVDGQAAVIAEAQSVAGASPQSIGYVEAHGTGTALGDPIEIAALTQAFSRCTTRLGFCALGSVKTNIGHLDTAAGIAGFIKTVLVLKHRKIPASLHFKHPNPQIDFAASPFFVNHTLREWDQEGVPRRAGVSAFGIGGTNAHVILEEAPPQPPAPRQDDPQLLLVSAREAAALENAVSMLATRLEAASDITLGDAALTLRAGRHAFSHRHAVVADSLAEAARSLRELSDFSATAASAGLEPVMLFSGQGSQQPGMGRDLYARLPGFRVHFDACADRLDQLMGMGFREHLFAGGDDIHRTDFAQPALFALEYALAQVWLDLGVRPCALHGHSIGEYVAACIAGVLDLHTALALVVERGRLMQAAPAGEMLSIVHPHQEIDNWLGEVGLVVAARNAPGLSVASGSSAAIARLEERLTAHGIGCRKLKTSHAFHSPMMAAAAAAFRDAVARVQLAPPKLPVISNLTGTWLSDAQAMDPDYWAQHLLGCVRFGDGMKTLLDLPNTAFIEIGPGRTLSALAEAQARAEQTTIPSLGNGGTSETRQMLSAIGRYWQAGGDIERPLPTEAGRRVPLPTYPFRRDRYGIDRAGGAAAGAVQIATHGHEAVSYRPAWRRVPAPAATRPLGGQRLLIFDDGLVGGELATRLEHAGAQAYRVVAGTGFDECAYRCFTVSPHIVADHGALLDALAEREAAPDHMVFLWPLAGDESRVLQHVLALRSLMVAAIARDRPVKITVVTQGTFDVTGTEPLNVKQSQINGVSQVAAQESPALSCRQIDFQPGPEREQHAAILAARLMAELSGEDPLVALRGPHRWVREFDACDLPPSGPARLRRNGVFVLVGNLGDGLGTLWLKHLAQLPGVRLALLQDAGASPAAPPTGIETLDKPIDVTKAVSLGAALDDVEAAWGRIDGVFLSLSLINRDAIAPVTGIEDSHWTCNRRSKIAPMEALTQALAGRRVGFCCIQSSLSTVVGGEGLGAYAAAYHAVDLMAAEQNRQGLTPWHAINYAVGTSFQAEPHADGAGGRGHVNPFAVPPQQAWDMTARIIESGLGGQTIIACGDIRTPRPARASTGEAAPGHRGRRPALATPFAPPRNPIEAAVADIFQDLLGIDAIGVDDGFYELGGHSLLAIRAVARLREAFPAEVTMRDLLFETPTVAGIAAAIAERLPKASQVDAMAALLAQVEDLSDDEVNRELAEAGAP